MPDTEKPEQPRTVRGLPIRLAVLLVAILIVAAYCGAVTFVSRMVGGK